MHLCKTFVFHKIQDVHKSPYSQANIFNKAESKYMMIALQFVFQDKYKLFLFYVYGYNILPMRKLLWQPFLPIRQFKKDTHKKCF